MRSAEVQYWKNRYAAEGLEYRPRQGRAHHGGGGQGVWDQTAFRFRLDDGVESLQESDGGATWAAGLNVDLIDWPINRPVRLRWLYHHSVADVIAHSHRWRYSHNGGAYAQIEDDSSYVRQRDSTFIVHNDRATDFVGRLGTGTWSLGDPADTQFNLEDLWAIQFGIVVTPSVLAGDCEVEISLQFGFGLSVGDTLDFQVWTLTGLPLASYANTPRITFIGPELVPFERLCLKNFSIEPVLSAKAELHSQLSAAAALASQLSATAEVKAALSATSTMRSALSAKAEWADCED